MKDASNSFMLDVFLISRVAGTTTLDRSVACRTFQSSRIGIKLNSFLVERKC